MIVELFNVGSKKRSKIKYEEYNVIGTSRNINAEENIAIKSAKENLKNIDFIKKINTLRFINSD